MNSLQLELDNINAQLELLTYRKTQLDSIMSEYSDVVNRVKNLVSSMQDANIEPSNLLMEIEGIIFNVQPDLEPTEEPTAEEQEPTPEELPEEPKHFNFDLRLFPKVETTLNSLGLPVTPEQRGNSLLFQPNTYWDNGSSVRMFVPKKRRYRGELEAIINDCIEQKLIEQFEINECGEDWIIQLSPVTDEMVVNQIIDNFYPKHTDGEPTPELTPEPVKLMALVPTVSTPTPSPEIIDDGVEQEEYLSYIKNHQPTPTPKTRLNERAWRRDNTLLIGFSNKKLLNTWMKWIKDSWGDSVNVTIDTDDEPSKGFPFPHCLSVLWYGSDISTNWERLSSLDYSLKPDEQPSGINLDDVRDVILKLQSNGLKFISKGELLAHHLNSLKASDLEEYLDKLAEEGLIILGNKTIDLLPTKTQDNEPEKPTFEYTEVDSKTTKIYNNGMLLGIAKNCGSHWESPQFPGQTFPNRRDVVAALWELVNNS